MPTVTLLFVDQVGSTAQLEALGDVMAGEVRRTMLDQIRRAVRASSGREIEFTGDGLFAAFPSAGDAVACAQQMQRVITEANVNRPVEERVHLRIGLHSGEPASDADGRLFGLSVVTSRRLCDLAGAGEILASDVVRALVDPTRAATFLPAGMAELKGMTGSQQLWQVEWTAGPDAPTTRSVIEPQTELPIELPSDPGRDPNTTPSAMPLTPTAATERLGPPVGLLLLPDGGALPLGPEPCVFGRSTSCGVVVDDANVSRRHAEIRLIGSHLVLRDLGSTNGTLVNEVPVLERVLVDGDVIGIGMASFRFSAAAI